MDKEILAAIREVRKAFTNDRLEGGSNKVSRSRVFNALDILTTKVKQAARSNAHAEGTKSPNN